MFVINLISQEIKGKTTTIREIVLNQFCFSLLCAATSFSACNFLSRCILLLTLNIDVKDYFFVLLKQTVHDFFLFFIISLCFAHIEI